MMKELLSHVIPSKGAVARTLVTPVVRSTVQDFLTEEPQDQVDIRGEQSQEESLVARAAGVAAGTAAGLATTVICAAKYPVSAVVMGVGTTAAVLKTQTQLPLPERTACALAAGGLAAAYAPAVAGAVVAVATEEVVTAKVDQYLRKRQEKA